MDEQMQPGPGLDAAVAAALGFRRERWKNGIGEVGESWVHEDGERLPYCPPRLYESVSWGWRPSTDWGAAGLVVERLKAKGYDIEIGYDSVDCSWVASFMKGEKWGIVTVEIAPHAICLAALATLEASVKEK